MSSPFAERPRAKWSIDSDGTKYDGGSIINTPSNAKALDQVREGLLAIPYGEVLRDVRVSPAGVVAVVEAAVGRLMPLREQLIALCPQAAHVLDMLPIYARAVGQAAVEEFATAQSGNLSEVHDVVRTDYDVIISELDSLVARKILDPSVIAPARGIQGYEETIKSMRVAVFVATKHWSTIEGKTQLTPAMLEAAGENADALERAIIDRDGGVTQSPAVELRIRALSKLLTEYDELRRMVRYLRWHERDYDKLAPSPFGGRRGRGASEEEDDLDLPNAGDDGDEDAPPPPVTPSPNDGDPFTS